MINSQGSNPSKNPSRLSKITAQRTTSSIPNRQDLFGFLKDAGKALKSATFFSKNGLSQDIIEVTNAEPDFCLEVFYALYHALWPQIEKLSYVSFRDAWMKFIGGSVVKGSLCPPEKLIAEKMRDIIDNLSSHEERIFHELDQVVKAISHLKEKVQNYSGQIFQQEEIIATLELAEAFYQDYRKKMKTIVEAIIEKKKAHVLYESESNALEDLLEPKAVMMSDIFPQHWAYRISKNQAQKLLSLNRHGRIIKNNLNDSSNHRVVGLPEKNSAPEPLVFFKANGNPAIRPEKEFMLYNLYRHLQIPVPETALLILTDVFETNPECFYAVQASEAVIGGSAEKACTNVETIFEEEAYVLQVIGTLLTNPSDGSFKNFKYSPKYKTLISIDNDSVFKPELSGKENKKIVNTKSILYLLPQIENLIPQSIKTLFTTLDPHLTILSWLQDLDKKNRNYQLLFARLTFQNTRCIYQSLFPQDELIPLAVCLDKKILVDPELDNGSFYPQIFVSESLLTSLTEKLQIIEKTLLHNDSVSSQILFEEISPILGKYYLQLRLEFTVPEEALDAVWDPEKKSINSSYLESTLSSEKLDSLSHNENGSDEDQIPETFFTEYKNKLVSQTIPLLDKFIERHSQRKANNVLNLSQTLEELRFLIQEGLIDSQSPQDIVDFCYNLPKMTEIGHHLHTVIISLFSNLPPTELKWLFTLEKYFKRTESEVPEDLKLSSFDVTGAFMNQRIFNLTKSEKFYLFDSQGKIKKNTSLTGRCDVTCFPEKDPEFYLKQYPEWPGFEFASTLFMRLFGVTHLPYQELLLNKNPQSPILLTQAVYGNPVFQVWQNPEIFNNLDPFHTGLLIIAAMLLNPEDGKEDNFLLSPDGRYLIPVDNDHCFLPSTFQKGKFWNFFVNTALQTKTLLFCLDEMDKPIPLKVKEHIISINFDSLLTSWMEELVKVEDRYNHLADQEQQNAFREKGTVFRILFYEQFIDNLYWKVNKIQDLLRSNTCQTPFSLLRAVEPFAARCYHKSFQNEKTLRNRFKAATNELYVEPENKMEKSRMSILNTQSMMNIINLSEKDLQNNTTYPQMGPPDALKVLSKLIQERSQNKENKILEQNLLFELNEKNEESLWTSLFGNPLLETALNDFFTNPKEGLVLKGSRLITSSNLRNLFEHRSGQGAKIKFLSIPNSPLLDSRTIRTLVEDCPNLEYLNVSGCMGLEEIVTAKGEWDLLARLEARDCFNFKRLTSLSPIKILRIGTHQKIEILVKKHILEIFAISTKTCQFDFFLEKDQNFHIKPLEEFLLFDNFLQNALLEKKKFDKYFRDPKIMIGEHSISSQEDLETFITSLDLRTSDISYEMFKGIAQLKLINLKRLQLPKLNGQETKVFEDLVRGYWSKLGYLNLSDNKITDEGLAILSQRNWVELEMLNLNNTEITEKGFLIFILNSNCFNLKEVTFFEISDKIPDFFQKHLPKNWNMLKALNLSHSQITQSEIEIIATKSKWPNLKDLNLSFNDINDEGFAILPQGNWPQLEKLNLAGTKVTNKGLLHFYANIKWSKLQSIILPPCIDFDMANYLHQKQFSKVERLELTHAEITSIEIDLISNNYQFQQLKYLNFSNSTILDKELSRLALADWPLLEELHIKKIKITQHGVAILVDKMKLHKLKKLDISENAIGDEGLKILASAKWPLFQHLVFYDTKVTPKGNITFLENCPWQNLQHLELSLTESFYNYNEDPNKFSRSDIILAIVPAYSKGGSLLMTVLDMTWPNLTEIFLSISHDSFHEKAIILPRDKANQLEEIKLSFNTSSMIQFIVWPLTLKKLNISNNSLSDQEKLESLFLTKCPLLEDLNLDETDITTKSIQMIMSKSDWFSLKTLCLSHNQIFDEGLELLLSGKWSFLESLNLRSTGITANGLKSLKGSLNWMNLKALDISDNFIYNEGLEVLFGGEWHLLENLNLQKTHITTDGVERMISLSEWPNLRILDISGNVIDCSGLQILSLGKWPLLESLHLSILSFTKEGIKNLGGPLNIKTLDISDNFISNEGLKVVSSGQWPLLENLNLRHSGLTADGIESMVRISRWPNLKILNISHNLISERGLKFLSSGKWPFLENLNLCNTFIRKAGTESLAKRSKWPNLKSLDVSHNCIQDEGLEFLSSAEWPLLESLNLSSTFIKGEGVISMVKISKWSNLKALDVSLNELSDKGLKALSSGKWPALESLSLKFTDIRERGFRSMSEISNWPNLKNLDVSRNYLYDQGLEILSSGKWPFLENLKLIRTKITVWGIRQMTKKSEWPNMKEIHLLDSEKHSEISAVETLIASKWPKAKLILYEEKLEMIRNGNNLKTTIVPKEVQANLSFIPIQHF